MEARERTSRAEWQKRIERWSDSGLSAEQFAAELGINAGTLLRHMGFFFGIGRSVLDRQRAGPNSRPCGRGSLVFAMPARLRVCTVFVTHPKGVQGSFGR